MKLTKGRLALVLLGLVAIVLLGIMVGLQLLIIGSQNSPAVAVEKPAVQAQATPVPPTPVPPTPVPPTPVIPTPVPATPTPAPPLATTAPPTLTALPATPTPEPPTLTALPPTATLEVATVAPTAVAAIALATQAVPATVAPTPVATNTAETPADLRIGYTERALDCKLVTDIVQLVLERQMGFHIAKIHFKNADDLFAALASTTSGDRVDLTLCYIDPDDRTYLGNYGSSLRFLDGNYGESNKKKFYAVINSALISPLKAQQPCLHSFLTKLDFADMQFQDQDATQWLAKNSVRVSAWRQCP